MNVTQNHCWEQGALFLMRQLHARIQFFGRSRGFLSHQKPFVSTDAFARGGLDQFLRRLKSELNDLVIKNKFLLRISYEENFPVNGFTINCQLVFITRNNYSCLLVD